MRIYKIILMSLLTILILMMLIGFFSIFQVSEEYYFILFFILFAGIGIVVSLLSFLYHIKSFHYYRKSKSPKTTGKLATFLSVSSIICGIYYFLFAVLATLGKLSSSEELLVRDIILIIVIALFGVLTILEVVITQKQIKKLLSTYKAKESIETIGDF
ncbi:hypothetical protein [Kordia jejudonensis]|uniref:hypothetical protein n=1 Tax=Kordia jejudonensis TaxID=1348245 RepID=UPI000629CFDA|nr:hypothetical protein [Kordia jejudonensis]